MELNSEVLSRGIYIRPNVSNGRLTIMCNWCQTRTIFVEDTYYEVPGYDWVSAAAAHFIEEHKDEIRDITSPE